jgi:glycosyltransferase involved in cell wall biosynthesis
MDSPVISVVIPVYCEEDILAQTLDYLQQTLVKIDLPYELIIVDDGSTDGTWKIVQQEAQSSERLRAARFSRNFGKEGAIHAGLELADGQAVILMDGDLQHPPEVIVEMVRIWRETDAEVIESIKEKRGKESLMRRLGAWFFYTLLRLLSGYDLTGLSDFKLLDRKVVDAWLDMRERNRFFRGMIAWLGFKHATVKFVPPKRMGGNSRWNLLKLAKLTLDAITAFSTAPLQIVSILGALFLAFAGLLTLRLLFQFINGNTVSEVAAVILLLLIIGSSIMLALGIIGTYLARIYEEVKERPSYVISSTIDEHKR